MDDQPWCTLVCLHWSMNLGDGNVLADVLTSAASWNSEQPLLTYTVPAELQEQLHPGQLVAIPYGERLVEGIVWSIQSVQAVDEAEIQLVNDTASSLMQIDN